MCVSCGCAAPDDNRGDGRQIIASHLRAAAEANGISLIDVAENVLRYARDIPQSEQHPKASDTVPIAGGQPSG